MSQARENMVGFIREVIARCGGRIAGSEEETRAQAYVVEQLSPHTDAIETQEFKAALSAKFEALKVIFLLFYLALIPINLWISLAFATLAAVLFLGNFLLNLAWLDFMFPQKISRNVTAVLEPKAEVKTTVWVAGHIDSVYEFQWWYHLKALGIYMNFASAALLFGLPLFYAAFAYFIVGLGIVPTAYGYIYWTFVALSPVTLSFFFMRSKLAVDGASDNLSGVAIALQVFNSFANPSAKGQSKLKHTRLRMISFGSEETGLKGSKAFVRDNAETLKQGQHIVVNIDTIKEAKQLSIVFRETNSRVTYSEAVIERVERAFQTAEIGFKKVKLKVGGTDAGPFQNSGIPSVSIIGMDSDNLDESYHTRLDTLDKLDPQGLEDLYKVLIELIAQIDAE